MSVRDRQIEALKGMLNLTGSGGDSSDPTWKVLVYDKTGQNVIGPLLSVKDLRELGVTLHLPLHSERDCIPEAPAVYFCLPTEENIHRICQVNLMGLFTTLLFGFLHLQHCYLFRQKLEDIATAALQSNTVSQIQKLFDQYVNFISLESEMFCLKQPKDSSISYYNLNRGSVQDTEMEEMLDTITESLFSLCVTLGTVPIIRCPKGNAAEAVAEKLDKKLRDNLKDARNSLFGSDGAAAGRYSFHRPVLVLVDRSVDMATPLHHTWTYQALAHDVLPYHQNRVTIPGGEGIGGARKKDKEYELSTTDAFWNKHKGSPFPQVAEAIQESLEEIKAKQEDIQRMKSDLGKDFQDDGNIFSLTDNTARLTSAMSDLPMLLEKKRLMDMHTSLATAVLDNIKKRRLDVFFELEEKIMSGSTLDKSIIDILNDPENGTPDDKLRLFLIYYLCTNTITDAEFDQYTTTLQNSGCQLAALTYLKRCRSFSMIGAKNFDYNQAPGMTTTKSVSMFSKLMEKSSNFVMEGVKNLVVKKHDLPVTKIVDDIMEQKTGRYNDEYRYLDPKILRGGDSIPRTKTTFNDAILFVVGGGNYIEYQNLTDYVKGKNAGNPVSGKRVVYGCTQLCSADQFLEQIKQLGTEI
ncbi:sec1 family domain-containing protein 1 [Eurytemora carolleeae]|uniref:sec1 family domain-containing protein 1 n=1 Tax=Eurytemora carolleeae TaxID=1294199 RepID=UPI000C77667A|nr:sec1 family domain-containing protein 1 [Eurytemora carolleeae]|eukprot:XP_023327317.1 sec1 family domain-containing protein 1-like [Eurytemora affinis]